MKEIKPSAYVDDFLTPAHNYRYGTQLIDEYGFKIRHSMRQNCKHLVSSQGWYVHETVDDIKKYRRKFGSIKDNNYSLFRNRIKKNDKHLFTTYSEDRMLNFAQFDFDAHGNNMSECINLLRKFQHIAKEKGIQYLLTTSPGYNSYLNGWIHGFYAWVKIDTDFITSVRDGRKLFSEWLTLHDMKMEHSCISRHRPLRLPGQSRVCIINPCTLQLVNENILCGEENWVSFVDSWETLEETEINAFKESIRSGRHSRSHTSRSSESSNDPNQLLSSGIWQDRRVPHQGYSGRRDGGRDLERSNDMGIIGSQINTLRLCPISDRELSEIKCTFLSGTLSRLCSSMTIQARGNKKLLQNAIEYGISRLPQIRPNTSKTCNDSHALRSDVSRWMRWYFDNFKEEKCPSLTRDKEDKDRINCLNSFDDEYIVSRSNLSYQDKRRLSKLLTYIRKYNGRVSAIKLYGSSDSIFNKKEWFSFLFRAKNIISIIVPHQKGSNGKKGKCRQWCISTKHMSYLNRIKKEIVYDTATLSRCEQPSDGGFYVLESTVSLESGSSLHELSL